MDIKLRSPQRSFVTLGLKSVLGREPQHKYLSPTPAFETKRYSNWSDLVPESGRSLVAEPIVGKQLAKSY